MARYPWLRLYTEIVDDPKLSDLSGDEFRLWVYMLCLARESEQPGMVLMSIPQLVWRTRRPKAEIARSIEIFEQKALIHRIQDVGFSVCRFEERNPPSKTAEYHRKVVSDSRREGTAGSQKSDSDEERGSHVTLIGGHTPSKCDPVEERREEVRGEKKRELPENDVVIFSPGAEKPAPRAPPPSTVSKPKAEPVLDPAEWPESIRDVPGDLDEMQAPKSLYKPDYWLRLDQWLGGDDTQVVIYAELRKYLAWLAAKPSRHRDVCRGFRNWLAKAEAFEDHRNAQEAFRKQNPYPRYGARR